MTHKTMQADSRLRQYTEGVPACASISAAPLRMRYGVRRRPLADQEELVGLAATSATCRAEALGRGGIAAVCLCVVTVAV